MNLTVAMSNTEKIPLCQSTKTADGSSNAISDPNVTMKMSYASASKASNEEFNPKDHPTKDMAIIFPFITGLNYIDYINEVTKRIPPKEILFASKISHERMCIYLSGKEWVDKIIAGGNIITKKGEVSVRRMMVPASRLIISNVIPSINSYP